MSRFPFPKPVETIAIASLTAALLAGCGVLRQAQDDAELPLTTPEGAATQTRAAKDQDLLYVIVGTGAVNFVTYPDGNKVGSIEYGLYSYLTGECSDRSGNVWIADYGTLAEYAHGGTKAIAYKSLPWYIMDCAVDPASNDLAAVGQRGHVYVFRDERGKPHVYHTKPYFTLRQCGYDAHGNLFLDGSRSYNESPVFFELPSGSSKLVKLTLDEKIGSAGQIQWDGRYVAIQDRDKPYHIYQVQFSGTKGTVVNTIAFTGLRKPVGPSWIEGATVLVPYGDRGRSANAVAFFNYSAGGKPVKILEGATYRYVTAVTVSRGSAP